MICPSKPVKYAGMVGGLSVIRFLGKGSGIFVEQFQTEKMSGKICENPLDKF